MSTMIRFSLLRRAILPAFLAWGSIARAGEIALITTSDATDKANVPSATAPLVKSDSDVQRDVIMALMHDDVDNGLTYRNVKIVVVKGKVTLTGRVKNEKQKTKLIGIVAKVVGPANLQDQIQVR